MEYNRSSWKQRLLCCLAVLAGTMFSSSGADRLIAGEKDNVGVRSAPPRRFVSARGEVLSAKGEPLGDARVVVIAPDEFNPYDYEAMSKTDNRILADVRTDRAGHFHIPRFEVPKQFTSINSPTASSRDYRLIITAPGYALHWKAIGNAESLGKIRLESAPSIEGRLLNHGGQPLPEVQVAVRYMLRLSKSRDWYADYCELDDLALTPSARTDADGRFVIPQIPLQTEIGLIIRGRAFQGYRLTVSKEKRPATTTKEPGGANTTEPEKFGRNFTARLPQPKPIRGRVVFADKAMPAAKARVYLTNGLDTETNAAGQFQFEPMHAQTTVGLIKAPAGSGYLDVTLNTWGEAALPMDFKLPRGVPLTGEVVDEVQKKGIPQVHVEVMPICDFGNGRVPVENWHQSDCLTDERGRFSLLVPIGEGTIKLTRAPRPYLTGVSPMGSMPDSKSKSRYFRSYSTKAGRVTDVGRFEIGRGVLVKGRVLTTDGSPVPKAQIFGVDGNFYSTMQESSNESDTFESADISQFEHMAVSDAEGRYAMRVSDVPKITIFAARIDGRLKGHQQIELTGTGGEREVTRDLILQPTGTLRLKVLQGTKPPAEFAVDVSPLGAQTIFMSAGVRSFSQLSLPLEVSYRREADGTVVVSNVYTSASDQPNELRVRSGERRREISIPKLEAGKTHDLGIVQLEPQLGLEVKVVDRAGKPVSGAKLKFHQQCPRDSIRFVYPSAATDQRGIIRFYDLPAKGISFERELEKSPGQPDYVLDADDQVDVALGRKSLVLRIRRSPEQIRKEREKFGPSARERAWNPAAPIEAKVPDLTNAIGMKLRPIPAGSFDMGSPASEEGRSDDEKQHRVEITQPFLMGKYEVTQAEYRKVMGRNPSHFSDAGEGKEEVIGLDTNRCPVENVSWWDAVEFCNRLSELEKLAPYYKLTISKRDANHSIVSGEVTILGGTGYRLPTEAEWEYACRAGTSDRYHFGNRSINEDWNIEGNFERDRIAPWESLNRTTSVGRFVGNNFGLHDMHGNVAEWCQDYYAENYYSTSPANDPPGPEEGDAKIVRGGGWDLSDSRSAQRVNWGIEGSKSVGFRVVRKGTIDK